VGDVVLFCHGFTQPLGQSLYAGTALQAMVADHPLRAIIALMATLFEKQHYSA